MVRDEIALMLTITTQGTALGDEERAGINRDLILPAEPVKAASSGGTAADSPLTLPRDQLWFAGNVMGTALVEELGLGIWALSVQLWYAHVLVAAAETTPRQMVDCMEQAVRDGLKLQRPIWCPDYGVRFCFDEESVRERIEYVQRHNTAVGRAAKPWPFVETPSRFSDTA